MTLLKRRQKGEEPAIRRRKKVKFTPEEEQKILKKRKPKEEEKFSGLIIRRRNHDESGKKRTCNEHKDAKIIYTSSECPMCDNRKLVSALCQTIDEQRQTIKKGFDAVYEKLLLKPEDRFEKKEHKEEIHTDDGISIKRTPTKIKRRKRK